MSSKIPEVIPLSDLGQGAAAERELLARLVQGEQEIAAEQGEDLAAVLAEADAILNRRNADAEI
ncbi:MAG TPA: hypothetical protein VNM67_24360 [Thermoanaerobaculia bacterium]|jgi:hypothetical protein|nr:hypothetical protein [Thermoanaerobaculia bacterium]